MTPAEMSSAATFEAWATGAAAITTTVAILLGGTWAVWRFILPGLFGPSWEGGIEQCSARMIDDGHFTYSVTIELKNVSYTASVIEELALGFFNHLPSNEEREATLNVNLFEHEVVCQTGVQKRITSAHTAALPLRDGVFVAWRINYRKPKLGIGWLGWNEHEKTEMVFVPVDTESLTLYSEWREPFEPEKGEEETSRGTPTTPD